MGILNAKLACKTMGLCLLLLLLMALPVNAAEIDKSIAKCAEIKDGSARLQCFDNLAKQNAPVKDTSSPDSIATAAPKEPAPGAKQISVMSQQWELDGEKGKSTFFMLRPYRPNYFLPVAYNFSPNENTALDFDPDAKPQHNEAKFQLSFKVKPWCSDIEGIKFLKGIDLWFAYTQLSFWQLYNSTFSSPFRDTNYEPEMLVNFRTSIDIPGIDDFKLRFVNIGFNHQSNGRSAPLSRSWNRVVANAGLEKGNFNMLLKTWYIIPEDEQKSDNPDIARFMGYGELWLTYYWHQNRFAAMVRNNLREDNRGAVQLDWSIPLSLIWDKLDMFSIYLQYFNGYGESLLDYNTSVNRISAGFMLVDWN
jgi:phospholipase A1